MFDRSIPTQRVALAIGVSLALVGSASALVVYDESADGDFADTFASPTVVTLTSGDNRILGQTGGPSGDNGEDYFQFDVGAGEFVDAFTIASYAVLNGSAGNRSFLAYSADPIDGFGSSNIDAWVLYTASTGQLLGTGDFPTTLGPGTHYFWVQENSGAVETSYEYSINLVPEPAAAGLLGMALLALTRRRR